MGRGVRVGHSAVEYIIILAVVVVVAVIGSMLLFSGPDVDGVANSELFSSEVGTMSYSVSQDSASVVLRNNHQETIRIDTVSINDIACDSADLPVTLFRNEKKTITCSNINASGEVQYSYSYEIVYTKTKLDQQQTLSLPNLVGTVVSSTAIGDGGEEGDVTPPSLSSLNPSDGSSDVGVSTNLVMTFSENVQAGSGNLVIYNASDDSVVETIAIGSAGFSTNTVTFNPVADLDYDSSYYVQIAATAIDDTSGNSYAGISDTTTWNFATVSEPVYPPGVNPPAADFTVSTCVELQNMKDNLTAVYELTADIDCSATTGWNSGAGFEPIGNATHPFLGALNGANYVVDGLYINRPTTDYVGLLGFAFNESTYEGAQIYNIGFTNADITGDSIVGTIIGIGDGGFIVNSFAEGVISSTGGAVGGLAGQIQAGYVNSSYAKVNLSSVEGGSVGLLVGLGDGLDTNAVYAVGELNTTGNAVGGLVGYGLWGSGSAVFVDAFVNSTGSDVGAIYGNSQSSSLTQAYWYNYSDSASSCYGDVANACDSNAVSLISEFYDNANPPLSSWDFTNVWGFPGGSTGVTYPCLLWEDGCSAPAGE